MATADVLKQYFIDIQFRTNAADGKQAQLTLHTLDVFAAEAQKSIDTLKKSVSGLMQVLDAFGLGNQQVIGGLRGIREETEKNSRAATEAHRTQSAAEKDAADATKARIQAAENERKRVLQQQRSDADQQKRDKADADRVHKRAEEDKNKALEETARRVSDVRAGFIAMATTAAVAAREVWRTLREGGKEYAALAVDAKTFNTSVRELRVLSKAIEITGFEKLRGQFEAFSETMEKNSGRSGTIATYVRDFTGMRVEVFKNLSPMQQYIKTLETAAKMREHYEKQGYTRAAATQQVLGFTRQGGLADEGVLQYINNNGPKVLEDAWKSANEAVAKNTEEVTKRFDEFNSAMIKFNQNIEEIVKAQRSHVAALFTPWITGFDNFLRDQPWAAIPTAIVHDFGAIVIELGKQFGEIALILWGVKSIIGKGAFGAGAAAGAQYAMGFKSTAGPGMAAGGAAGAAAGGAGAAAAAGGGFLSRAAGFATRIARTGVVAGVTWEALQPLFQWAYDAGSRNIEDPKKLKAAAESAIAQQGNRDRYGPLAHIDPRIAGKDVYGDPIEQIRGLLRNPDLPNAKETLEAIRKRNPGRVEEVEADERKRRSVGPLPVTVVPGSPGATSAAPTTQPVPGPERAAGPYSEMRRRFGFSWTTEKGEEKDPNMQHGGIVKINAHEGEMVLPRNISEGLQKVMTTGISLGEGGSDEVARTVEELNDTTRDYSQRVQQWLSGSTGIVPFVRIQETPGKEKQGAGAGGGTGAGGGAGGAGAGAGAGAGGGGAQAGGAGAGGGGAQAGGGGEGGAAPGGEGGGGGPKGGDGKLPGQEGGSLSDQAISVFKQRGWSDAAIQAVMAHGLGEGGFGENWKQSGVVNKKTGEREQSFGHWQFNMKGGEGPAYMKWAKDKGLDPKDTRSQAMYVAETMEQRGGKGFTQSTDFKSAFGTFETEFERSKGGVAGKLAYAQQQGTIESARRMVAGYKPGADRAQPAGGASAGTGTGDLKDRQKGITALRAEMDALPGAKTTSGYRDPEHELSKANPGSAHVQALAFDTHAKTEKEVDEAQEKVRAMMSKRGLVEGEDYKMIDEVRHRSPHATGPHLHTELTTQGMAKYQKSVADQQQAQGQNAPIVPAQQAAATNAGSPLPPLPGAPGERRLPPGTLYNSRGEPYSPELTTMSAQEKANVERSMAAIKQGVNSGQGWGQWTEANQPAQQVAAAPQQQAAVRQPFEAFPEVPKFELGGLIPRMLQGVLPALLHPGEMILPRGLSDGLQGLIGAFGGAMNNRGGGFGQMQLPGGMPGIMQGLMGAFGGGRSPLGMLPGMMGMAGNMMGMFNRPLGGDFRNMSYDQRMDNTRNNNVNLTQVNNMNLGGFTGDSSGDMPRRLAAVHRRTAGDLVRNFQLAVR